jgi:hypothetical protein
MKTKIWKLSAVLLLLAMGSVLTVCNTLQQDRPMPAQIGTHEMDAQWIASDPMPYEYPGTVVSMMPMSDACELNILLDDHKLLLPYNYDLEFELLLGTRVKVRYEELQIQVPECAGRPSKIYSIREIPAPGYEECVYKGRVVDADDDDRCGLSILLETDLLIYPALMRDPAYVLEEGDYVMVGFTTLKDLNDAERYANCNGLAVEVLCLTKRSPDLDEPWGPGNEPKVE